MNEEEKQKVGKRFFDVIDKIMLTPDPERVEEVRQKRREGNVYQRTTQAIGDAKDKVLGTVFSPVAKGIEAVSDATNIDERGVALAGELIMDAVLGTKFSKGVLSKTNRLGRRLGGKLQTVDGSTLDNVVDVANPYKVTSQTQQDILSQVNNKITSVKPITITSTGNVPVVVASSSSGPTGKITARNLPRLEDFLSGNSISLDRTTAGLIQNPNFKLNDFLSGIEEELPQIRAKYPRIDVDTNLQRFKWQWHHINPDKMPVDFYVGLNNVNDRNVITDTLLRETGVSAGMNPTNRIGLPTEVHDEITDWLDTEIGRRSEVITQKISDDFGFGLTLTGPGSRAAKLRFNQLFASVPLQQRLPYIREYGEKIAESTQILDDLMRQFDIFYEIPRGYRLDIDVNTMERMLARLDEGKPTIPTLREIIEEVTDGLRIPATDNLGRQAVAIPRDPNLIRAIDLEGMLRDHKNKQSVLNQRQITSIKKELNAIYQLNLDIKGASASAYIRNWYKERFGGTRKTGKK